MGTLYYEEAQAFSCYLIEDRIKIEVGQMDSDRCR